MNQNDAISRSAAIEALNQHSYETSRDYDKTVELLNELPAIDVAPVVHARWVLEESPFAEHEEAYDGESHDRYVCSKCGHEAGYMCDPDGFADGQDLTPWCGKCGALMDGEADG